MAGFEAFVRKRRCGRPYRETYSGLVRVEVKGPADHQVEIQHSLTNFTARIFGDVSRDDGTESTRAFEIEARLGERSRTFMVPAAQFGGMRWVTEQLGAQAVVYAGLGTADHARTAIQLLSRASDLTHRVYAYRLAETQQRMGLSSRWWLYRCGRRG